MNYIIREIKSEEYDVLEEFLYQAIYIPEGYDVSIPRSIIYEPDLWRHIDRFGELKDDYCFVAVVEDKVVGAVWVRTVEQYGHLDNNTPSFAISILKEYRKLGIGTALMKKMLIFLKEQGYKKASLSVQKANYAVRMYQSVGFVIIDENEEEYIMICDLDTIEGDSLE